jgi:cytochrome c556
MLRHNKPFKCDIPNCRRGGRGFTTVNDLQRHKKSVHRINATENSFQCASETCRSKEKIWPRLDNFKQHIHRMHKDEDEGDLIRR